MIPKEDLKTVTRIVVSPKGFHGRDAKTGERRLFQSGEGVVVSRLAARNFRTQLVDPAVLKARAKEAAALENREEEEAEQAAKVKAVEAAAAEKERKAAEEEEEEELEDKKNAGPKVPTPPKSTTVPGQNHNQGQGQK